MSFSAELKKQRWDDHRYYHHCRVNQSLHLLSAISFLGMYVMLFFNPVVAAFLGWLVAMILRQAGHFFFEPKTYDVINQATHEFKESIKVGYNLRRKVILMTLWVLAPVVLLVEASFFGLLSPHEDVSGYLYNVSLLWLLLGAGAIVFRTAQLFFVADVQTGLVWFTKILTDPFHDIKMYGKSPWYLLHGERFDPMTHVSHS